MDQVKIYSANSDMESSSKMGPEKNPWDIFPIIKLLISSPFMKAALDQCFQKDDIESQN